MRMQSFTLFPTDIGSCAIVWGERGILLIKLPEQSESETRASLRGLYPEAKPSEPPARVRSAIDDITALLEGQARDLGAIRLDMESESPFRRRVYEATRTIPPGSTLSYGDIAGRMGMPGAARAVGQALGRNPFALVVPCHRVLATDGKLGGFSAAGGIDTKRRLLQIEGVLES